MLSTDFHLWADELQQAEPWLLKKIQAGLDIDPQQASTMLIETLKFLYLVAHRQQRLTPSMAVDLTWHEFILFTRCYAAFCQEKFGRFIHHSPGGSDQANRRNFERTVQYYAEHWGAPPADAWGETATLLYEEALCGSCISSTD